MALLFQRLDIVTPRSKALTDKQRIDYRKFKESWVHYHLGGLIALVQDGLEVEVMTLNEPIVTNAATGLNRSGASLIYGECGNPMWWESWCAFRSWASISIPLDVGDAGEAMGQALFLAAHDQAERPSWYRKKARSACKDAYRGDSAFVHVKELFKKLFSTPIPAAMSKDLDKFAWVNYQRFSRASEYGFTRQDLITAFWMRRAIVGAKGQRSWDYVVPVYCGSLTRRFDPNLLSWIEVQTKTRRTRTKTTMTPQSIVLGSLLTADEKKQGVQLTHRFKPRIPPILCFLDMSTGISPPEEAEWPTISSKSHEGEQYWLVDCPLFDQRNHPVLQEIWPNEPFPPLLPDMGQDLVAWGPEQQQRFREALTGERLFRNC